MTVCKSTLVSSHQSACSCLFPLCLYNHLFFFFNDTATTEIYTLSLHDALPISDESPAPAELRHFVRNPFAERVADKVAQLDRKSTRLNSSHTVISYAVFCLKKKKKKLGTHAPSPVLHAKPRENRQIPVVLAVTS